MTTIPVGPLLDLVPAHGVIGLGEPTHGSANAFAAKMELVLELAGRGMLSTFAFEESYALGLQVDEALRCNGDLDAAWAQATSVWRTPVIREGLSALQDLNRSLPPERRITFLGIDIKKPSLAAQALLDRGHDHAQLRALADGEDPIGPGREDLASLCHRLETVHGPTTQALARQILRWLRAYRDAPSFPDLHLRDRFMAAALLEHRPTAELTVVWAHNEHVANNPDFYGGPSLGAVLADELGTDYAAVGILCGEGTSRAVDPSSGSDDLSSVPLPPVLPGSTEEALAARGDAFVLTDEFSHPGPRRFLGWRIDSSVPATERGDVDISRPASDFSAIVHLPTSVADTDWAPACASGTKSSRS